MLGCAASPALAIGIAAAYADRYGLSVVRTAGVWTGLAVTGVVACARWTASVRRRIRRDPVDRCACCEYPLPPLPDLPPEAPYVCPECADPHTRAEHHAAWAEVLGTTASARPETSPPRPSKNTTETQRHRESHSVGSLCASVSPW